MVLLWNRSKLKFYKIAPGLHRHCQHQCRQVGAQPDLRHPHRLRVDHQSRERLQNLYSIPRISPHPAKRLPLKLYSGKDIKKITYKSGSDPSISKEPNKKKHLLDSHCSLSLSTFILLTLARSLPLVHKIEKVVAVAKKCQQMLCLQVLHFLLQRLLIYCKYSEISTLPAKGMSFKLWSDMDIQKITYKAGSGPSI